MTDHSNTPSEPETPLDPRAAERLDAYLSALQAGGRPDRAALLRDHPELESMLGCLEALENLAPSGQETLPSGPSLESPSGLGELPRQFGPYELLDEIGRGGMGVVYRARQEELGRIVAVKMILTGYLASEEHVRRFLIEAKAAAAVRHPNIVPIHQIGQLHGQHFFAMGYIEGKSLAERLANGRIEASETARIVARVARAVTCLHQHGIVHRDLKPSNILLDADGEPFVTDFGLAKVFAETADRTATGVIAGTPSYMAPEQASGQTTRVGPASDIFSLGTILYELLTGHAAFRRETPMDTLLQVISGEPVAPRQHDRRVAGSVELICMKCLAKSPEDRYVSGDALADDLERFLRGEPVQVRPPSLLRRGVSWFRRHPALATHLIVLGVFLCIAVGNHATNINSGIFYQQMYVLIAVWAGASIFLERALAHPRWSVSAKFLWGTVDAGLLLIALLIADGVASPLIVGYPLLIAASGLWWRVRFVWYMTVLSLISYGVLLWDFYVRRADFLTANYPSSLDRPIIFAVGLIALGGIIAYLVSRVRTLSNFRGS